MEAATIVQAAGWILVGVTALRAMSWSAGAALEHMRRNRQSQDTIRSLLSEAEQRLDEYAIDESTARLPPPGLRTLRIVRRAYETFDRSVCSLYLAAPDGAPLEKYQPGQFLNVALADGSGSMIRRCYSLSEMPTRPQLYYRISVKRLDAPHDPASVAPSGLASTRIVDTLQVGDVVSVTDPTGGFVLDQVSDRPIALIAGGIGITPLMSMLNWLVASGSRREICLIYGVRNSQQHPFKDHVHRLRKLAPNLATIVFYSQPTPECRRGIDYDYSGHIDAGMLKPLLMARDFLFYLCGPDGMMTALQGDLHAFGVPPSEIRTEAFGAAKTKAITTKNASRPVTATCSHEGMAESFKVTFSNSERRVVWEPHHGSLLDIAEACGVEARSSCRAGQCGMCKVRLRSGEVAYASPPTATVKDGTCLPCLARPVSDLVVEL